MKPFPFILLYTITMSTTPIFKFTKEANISNWQIVDDVVMGGRSNGNFSLNNNGYGVFSGKIALDNNGGFSSLRYNTKTIDIVKHTKVCIKLKGDGKVYQFRIKADRNERYSYITTFKTSGEWETIIINLKDMYPAFRGRILDYPNFNKTTIEELAFLIGNKKAEAFELIIDTITLD